jgi:hypothetical protein
MPKYSVNQQPVETLLAWIKSGDIAIPEIQRPFVWKPVKVRDLIDSLYNGYPVGYLITWRNPDIKLKNGDLSFGKKILIDGQQRITALTAAIVGRRVLNKNYKEINIRIAFNPITEKFDVLNSAISKSPEWIDDISPIIDGRVFTSKIRTNYMTLNPEVDENLIESRIEKLKSIKSKQLGVIELDHSLDIDTVTDIFIRINQKGLVLSNADFVMSKIAADSAHNGNKLRKMIDYFCRLIVDKDFNKHIIDNDSDFSNDIFYNAIQWMSKNSDDLYIPDYIDILRVAFTFKFKRGKFKDLVALLSGRNFISREYEDEIASESFSLLEEGLLEVVNMTNYQRFIMIVKSTGLIDNKLISSQTSLDFAYALYLHLREKNMSDSNTQKYIKRWLIMSLLTARYSGTGEYQIDEDIKAISDQGIEEYLNLMEQTHLSDSFWSVVIVNDLITSSTNNRTYNIYLASQINLKVSAFLAKSMTISTLIEQRGDIHHLFPKEYLKQNGYAQKEYNQVANLVYTEQSTNIKIGKKAPKDYMKLIKDEISNRTNNICSIDNEDSLMDNLRQNDIPRSLITGTHSEYSTFLKERRQLIAKKLKDYYYNL